jgi:ribosomal protein S18 acetylase RimI-like enzyme
MGQLNNQLTCRIAKDEDCALLAQLNRQLIVDEGHRNNMTVQELESRMRDWLSADYRAVIFEREKGFVAYALFRESSTEIYLRQLFVARDIRRQGIGRHVLRVLRRQFWPDSKRFTVEVLTSNTAALAFWRAMGYIDYPMTLEIMPGLPSQ